MRAGQRNRVTAGGRLRWRRLGALLIGLAVMGLFMFGVAPALQQWGPVRTVHTFVTEHDIDATPWFYTESEEFSRVQQFMADASRFEPSGP